MSYRGLNETQTTEGGLRGGTIGRRTYYQTSASEQPYSTSDGYYAQPQPSSSTVPIDLFRAQQQAIMSGQQAPPSGWRPSNGSAQQYTEEVKDSTGATVYVPLQNAVNFSWERATGFAAEAQTAYTLYNGGRGVQTVGELLTRVPGYNQLRGFTNQAQGYVENIQQIASQTNPRFANPESWAAQGEAEIGNLAGRAEGALGEVNGALGGVEATTLEGGLSGAINGALGEGATAAITSALGESAGAIAAEVASVAPAYGLAGWLAYQAYEVAKDWTNSIVSASPNSQLRKYEDTSFANPGAFGSIFTALRHP